MVRNISSYYFTLILLFASLSYSQPNPPVVWGDIPVADLEMKVCPSDSGAEAMVLCDYGYSSFDEELNIIYKRFVRIKIFNKAGFDWGTHSIGFFKKEEKTRSIEAATYILNENGKIDVFPLDDDDIFTEEVSERYSRRKFTLPNLQPGCIIEIKYEIISNDLQQMREWSFQESIPVRWSEYNIVTPKQIGYTVVPLGYEPYFVNERTETKIAFDGMAKSLLGGDKSDCWVYRWVTKDIPALKDEPYVTSTDNYINRIQVQLLGYNFVATGRKLFITTWEDVVKELMDADNFYNRIDVSGEIEETGKKITAGITDPLEKMKAIYNWVKSSIVWSGENRVAAFIDPDEVIEAGKGNSSEISLLLISLLKSAGIDSNPVIVSTRKNGYIQTLYPILSQFNYVIVRANITADSTYLLDATDPYRPYDILPEKVLNVQGLVIKEGPIEWIMISSGKISSRLSLTRIKVSKDGSINGNVEINLVNYDALNFRELLKGKTDIEVVQNLFSDEISGIELDSASIEGKDKEGPVKITASFSSSEYTQVSNGIIYLNPNIFYRMKDNPFKSESRKFPVDYAYKRNTTDLINIEMPEGYELKDNYQGIKFNLDVFAAYTSNGQKIDERQMQIINKTEIKSQIINPDFYQGLRAFYSKIVESQEKMIVLVPAGDKSSSGSVNGAPTNK